MQQAQQSTPQGVGYEGCDPAGQVSKCRGVACCYFMTMYCVQAERKVQLQHIQEQAVRHVLACLQVEGAIVSKIGQGWLCLVRSLG